MGKNKDVFGSNNEGLSNAGKILGHVALAIIIALLLWVGNTVHLNSLSLGALSQKVNQFQSRYYEEQKELKRRIETHRHLGGT